jgi:hypothetical protein
MKLWKSTAAELLLPSIELASPVQKADQVSLLLPYEAEEVSGAYAVRFPPGVSFDAPTQIFTAPRPQAMSTCGIPQKPHPASH